jgi:hypothetical protein
MAAFRPTHFNRASHLFRNSNFRDLVDPLPRFEVNENEGHSTGREGARAVARWDTGRSTVHRNDHNPCSDATETRLRFDAGRFRKRSPHTVSMFEHRSGPRCHTIDSQPTVKLRYTLSS